MKKRSKRKHNNLFDQVVELTGIPARSIKKELKQVLERKNLKANELTLPELRRVAASYLREIMGGLLDRPGQRRIE